MANVKTPPQTRNIYNAISSYYELTDLEHRPGQHQVAELAQPVLGEDILELGCGPGRLLKILIDKANEQQQRPLPPATNAASRSGSFMAVDLAEQFEGSMRHLMRQADETLSVRVCNAGCSDDRSTAVQTLLDNDANGQMVRGEVRFYLGMGANFLNPALIDHLVSKSRSGAGFNLITANHVMTSVSPVLQPTVLRKWGSALAPGGRLLLERPLYYPHPDAPLGLTCPGQLVYRQETSEPLRLRLAGHGQCAPDRFWALCEEQTRQLAAQAGFRVVRVAWANHGDHGAALGGGFSSVWEDDWEKALLSQKPHATDGELTNLLCIKADEEKARIVTINGKRRAISYNLVAVIAELVKA